MSRTRFLVALACAAALGACAPPPGQVEVPGTEGALKTAAAARAERRAYDGAPPVIPHDNFGMECGLCHNEEGLEVPDVGYAPPMPHGKTDGMSDISRCEQCHVFRLTETVFMGNDFEGLRQNLRRGERLFPGAPPTIPHDTLMRDHCLACHAGPAAREEIRTSHPERLHCRQCHAAVATTAESRTLRAPFQKYGDDPGEGSASLGRRFDDEYPEYSEENQRRQRRGGPAESVSYFWNGALSRGSDPAARTRPRPQ